MTALRRSVPRPTARTAGTSATHTPAAGQPRRIRPRPPPGAAHWPAMASASSSQRQPPPNGTRSQRSNTLHQQQRPKSTDIAEDVVTTHEARAEHNSSGRKLINEYEFRQKLGRGQHGEVYVAVDLVKNREVVSPPSPGYAVWHAHPRPRLATCARATYRLSRLSGGRIPRSTV